MTGVTIHFRDDTPDLKLPGVLAIRFKDGKVALTQSDQNATNHRIYFEPERIAWINLWAA
jgi:hypothetical protein